MSKLQWLQSKNGWWQSSQGSLTLFVAQEAEGWAF